MKREYTVLKDRVYLRNDKGVRELAPVGSKVMLTEAKAEAFVGKVELTSGIVIPPQLETSDAPQLGKKK